ncbi:MAG: SpoIIIAH-like family protein [Clostridia bacterium]|nr:SpoIIIAH-like family protein [Clostridia bacterium]
MKLIEKLTLKQSPKNKPRKRRMVVLHKRQITAVCLLILIGVAGYLNWSFQQDAVDPEVAAVYSEVSKKLGEAKMVSSTASEEPDASSAQTKDDYFTQAKLERDVKRSESMDMLTEILNAQGTDKAARIRAEDEIHMLSDFTEKEIMIENLIRAKGYEQTVVFMGENLISIAVKSEGLSEVDAAILQDIAVSTTTYPAEKIKIVEIQ